MSSERTFLCRVCSKPLRDEVDLLVTAIHSRPKTEELCIFHRSKSQLCSLLTTLENALTDTKVSGVVVNEDDARSIRKDRHDGDEEGGLLKHVLAARPPMIDDQGCLSGFDGKFLHCSEYGGMTASEIEDIIVESTRGYLVENGYRLPNSILKDTIFFSTGLDSLDLMMLAERISERANVDMELTALIDYPTVGALCRYIAGLCDGHTPRIGDEKSILPQTTNLFVIGVTGIDANLPMGSKGHIHDLFLDSVTQIPMKRWDIDRTCCIRNPSAQVSKVRFGAFLESIEYFDPTIWDISAIESEYLDPQQRLLLDGVSRLTLALGGSVDKCGVFVGASTCDYQCLISKKAATDTVITPFSVTATGLGVIPGRIAFHLGTQGPAIATDTACSSSLVSLSIAHQMTHQGVVKTSFACGCSLLIDQGQFQAFESANMLASDGRSKALEASADGFSRGEAVVALRLDEISEDSRGIMCILESIFVNQDGKSSRLTAPNGPAQTALIAETLRRSICMPPDVSRFMLHGTGTPLGDPIELGALLRVYGHSMDDDTRKSLLTLCAIKTSVGHSEAAAGIVSMSGAIVMQSMQFLPVLHLRRLNENFTRVMEAYSERSSCLSIKRCPAPSSGSGTGKDSIGISSFASQGTNCHAIVSLGHDQSSHMSSNLSLESMWRRKSMWIFPLPDTRIRHVRSTACSVLLEVPIRFPECFPDSFQECFIAVALDAMAVICRGKQAQTEAQGLKGLVCRDFASENLWHHTMRIQIKSESVEASIDGVHNAVADAYQCQLPVLLPQIPPATGRPLLCSCKQVGSSSLFFAKNIHRHDDAVRIPDLTLLHWIETTGEGQNKEGPQRVLTLSLCTLPGISGKEGYQIVHANASLSGKLTLMGYSMRTGPRRMAPTNRDLCYISDVLVDRCDSGACRTRVEKYYPLSHCNVNYALPISRRVRQESFLASLGFLRQSMACENSSVRIGNPWGFQKDYPLLSTQDDSTLAKFCDAVSHSFNRETCNGQIAFFNDEGISPGKGARITRKKACCIPQVVHYRRDKIRQRTDPALWMISGGTGGLGWLLTTMCAVDDSAIVCLSKSGILKSTEISEIDSINSKSVISFERGEVNAHEDVHQVATTKIDAMATCRFVHAGGVLHDASRRNLSSKIFRSMYAPKVSGLLRITQSLLMHCNLQHLVAFSSVAALLHPAGSSAYGAVNSIMDVLISQLPITGVAALSIQWGPWSSTGMVSNSPKVSKAMKEFGITMISPTQGLWTFSRLLLTTPSVSLLAVLPFDESQSSFGDSLHEVILGRGQFRGEHGVAERVVHGVDLRQIASKVESLLSAIIGNTIESQMESLVKYGADSLCAIEIQRQLSEEFNVDVPPSFLYDFPTVHSMSTAIQAMISDNEAYFLAVRPRSGTSAAIPECDPLGIKELILREPDGLQTDHSNFECTKIADFSRWDVDALVDNVPRARFGKYLSDIDKFDSAAFGIAAVESSLMDPQQRILLEDSLALRCTCREAQDEYVGVVVGLSFWDYSKFSEAHSMSGGDALKLTGRNLSVSSGRISFVHGYSGPSMSIDTACSSSIVAMSIATRLLTSDPLHSVIVGSALVSLSIDVMRFLAAASMISADGRCRTLDEEAAGYGRGEASACMLITRAATAPAVICAASINQDGHSASLTAPHGPSQIQVILQACADAGMSPAGVGMHELHGTGTALGDPIELLGVSKSHEIGSGGSATPLCISSSKPVYGHSEPAAGCIGIHWLLQQLSNRIFNPNIHLKRFNKHIASTLDASERAMHPVRELSPMELSRSTASLSSFAFQGTNAHAVLQYDTMCESHFQSDALRNMDAYGGQRHWYCPLLHPWMHPNSPSSSSQDISWSILCKQTFAAKMSDHRVFSTILLPGMCIFRIMSDAVQLCLARTHDCQHGLTNADIETPVHLEDMKTLSAKIRPLSGQVILSADTGAGEARSVATSSISSLPCQQQQAARDSECRGSLFSCHSKSDVKKKSIGWLAHTSDRLAELVDAPSPELLDGSTHLAAFSETLAGRAVSVPVSSECLSIAFQGIYTSQKDTFQGFAACHDADANERRRDYHVHLPTTKYSHIKSLYSASIKREKNRHSYLNFSNVEQIDSIRNTGDMPDVKYHQQMPKLHGSTIFSSGFPWGDPLRQYLTLVEFLRTQHRRSFHLMVPKKPSRDASSSRIRGQLQVADKEIGCKGRAMEHDTNAAQRHRTASWREIILPYSPTERPKYGSAARGMTAVSGGTNGIGLLLGHWLASRGVEMQTSLALIGRNASVEDSFPRSISRNIMIHVTKSDCATSTGAMNIEDLCRTCPVGFGANFFHGAGVILDQSLHSTTFSSSSRVFTPKVKGLERAAARAGHSLAVGSIVSLSTMSITVGNPGQSNYIAANSAMENLSNHLAFTGMDSRIIRYGPWKSIGMLAKKETLLKNLGKAGLLPLSPSQGLTATVTFIISTSLLSTIGHIRWDKVNAGRPVEEKAMREHSELDEGEHHRSDARLDYRHAREIVLEILGDVLDEVPMADDDPFFEIGIDSISSIEIHNRLSHRLNRPLPPTILFDYPSVSRLAKTLCRGEEVPVPHAHPVSRDDDHGVFVSSASQMLPSIGLGLFEEFVGLVCSAKDLHNTLPKDRWDFERHYSATGGGTSAYTNVGAFVPNIWDFDHNFFGLKYSEARLTDPQLRCLLHTTANAVHCCGKPKGFQGSGSGIYVGCMFYDYLRTIKGMAAGIEAAAIVGNGAPYLCGRIAYTFHMQGPCVGIDTACSSSLVAVDSAYTAISNREIRHSVACGTNAIICPGTSAMVCQLGALSVYGRCLSLDASADGYGRGEGIVSLVLSDECRDSDLAAIRATAINQDGRSISLTAPNGPSQEALLRACLAKGGLVGDDLDTVAIHGTGTLLGDPIESQALKNLPRGSSASPMDLVAVKALLGHCEGAAGTVGLLLSVYSAREMSAAAIQTLRIINPLVQATLDEGKLEPSREHAPQYASQSAGEIVSGSSSFGMSGTNAHAIISSPHPSTSRRDHGDLLHHRMHSFRLYVSESLLFVGLGAQHPRGLFEHDATKTAVIMRDHSVTGRQIVPAAMHIYIAFQTLLQTASTHGEWGMPAFAFHRPCMVKDTLRLLLRCDFTVGSLAIADRAHSGVDVATCRGRHLCMAHRQSRARYSSLRCLGNTNALTPTLSSKYLALIFSGGQSAAPVLDASFHLGAIHQSSCKIPVSCGSIHFDIDPVFSTPKSHFFAAADDGTAEYQDQTLDLGCVKKEQFQSRDMKVKHMPGSRTQQEFVWLSQPGFEILQPSSTFPRRPSPLCEVSDRYPLRLISTSLQTLVGGISGIEDDHSHLCNIYPSHPNNLTRQTAIRACLRRVYETEARLGLARPLHQDMPTTLADAHHRLPVQSSRRYIKIYKRIHTYAGIILSSLGGIGHLLAHFFALGGVRVRSSSRRGIAGSLPVDREIEIAQVDVSHSEDVQALLDDRMFGYGVMHTSGCLRDGLIRNLSLKDARETLAAKSNPFALIKQYAYACPCVDVCSFSSIASSLGSIGQAAYAAANEALDMDVRECFDRGLPYCSIQWGLWKGVGMAKGLHEDSLKRISSIGISSLTPIEGLESLEALLASTRRLRDAVSMVCKIQSELFERYLVSQPQLWHLLRGIKSRHGSDGQDSAASRGEVHATTDRRVDNVPQTLRSILCQHLDAEEEDLDFSAPVLQLGFDSVSSIGLLQSLETGFRVPFHASFLYDYVYLDDMVAYIRDKLLVKGPEQHPSTSSSRSSLPSDQVRIVSNSAIFGGAFQSFNGQRVAFGDDCVRRVLRNLSEEGAQTFASTLPGKEVFAFDIGMFKMSETTVIALDPNIRWMLTLTKDLLAGIDAIERSCGVYVGWMWSHENFRRLQRDGFAANHMAPSVTGNSAAFAVGYVAYLFGLNGPSIPIDTACSSSLVALHAAKQSIQSADCIDAVIMGANVFLDNQTWIKIAGLKALSPDGRCKTLDASADGYGRGEAFTSMYVSSLVKADVRDVIIGTAVNTVATRSSLTAPHGPSQVDVIQRARERSGNASVSGFFLHGTGTSLGDPIEIRALQQTLKDKSLFVSFQSPKSSVGHTEGSAGLTNALAALSTMRSSALLPVQHLRSVNPMMSFSSSTLSVPRTLGPYLCEAIPVCSGSSSFGMTGINSHAILMHSRSAEECSILYDVDTQWMPAVGWSEHVLRVTGTCSEFHLPPQLVTRAMFLRDHRVKSQSLLPGTLYIELAKEALNLLNQEGLRSFSGIAWNVGCPFDDLPTLKVAVEGESRVDLGQNDMAGICSMDCVRPLAKRRGHEKRPPDRSLSLPSLKSGPERHCYVASIVNHPSSSGGPLWRSSPMDAILHLGAIRNTETHVPVTMKFYCDQASLNCPDYACAMPPSADLHRSIAELSLGVRGHEIGIENHSLVGRALRRERSGMARRSSEQMYIQIYAASHPSTHEWQHSRAPSGTAFAIDGHTLVRPFLEAPHADAEAFQQSMSLLQGLAGRHVHLVTPRERIHAMHAPKDGRDRAVQEATTETFRKEQFGAAAVTTYFDSQAQQLPLDTLGKEGYRHGDGRVEYKADWAPHDWHPAPYFPEQILNLSLDDFGKTTQLTRNTAHSSGRTTNRGRLAVRVSAVGLNFRDLLMALGTYPSSSTDMGSDFAGFVSSSTVHDFKCGDAVFGQTSGTFRSEIHPDPDMVSPIPPTVSHEEASGTPTVYLTAVNCLKCFSHVSKGEAILIQSAAGGFGIAIADMARASGLTVVSTASTPARRRVLRGRGQHVFHSRHTRFAEDITLVPSLAIKGVVNTLTSQGMIAASTSVLQMGGTFVEVSKRDIFSADRMLQERADISHHTVAVDMMPSIALQRDLRRLCRLMAHGEIVPCPSTVMPLTRLRQALLGFKSPNNIGKIIWKNEKEDKPTKGTWLVTGGLGALGKLTSSLLVSRGCDVVIPSRAASKPCQPSLRDAKRIVTVEIGNISETESLGGYFTRTSKPMEGIVHSSGVLEDALLLRQTVAKARRVFASKSCPLYILESLTRNEALSGIVLYSSVSSVLGNAGQANYSSANKILDASSQRLSRQGHSCSVVNWGPWAGEGMAAGLNAAVLQSAGISLIDPTIGIHMVHHLLCAPRDAPLSQYICVSSPVKFDDDAVRGDNGGHQKTGLSPVPSQAPSKRPHMSKDSICREIRMILSSLLERDVDLSAPLMASGLDSLGSIQLVTKLSKTFAIEISSTFPFDYPTMESMADRIFAMKSPVTRASRKTSAIKHDPGADRSQAQGGLDIAGIYCMLPEVEEGTGDAARTVPFDRWDADAERATFRFSGPMRFGGFTSSLHMFDNSFFRMSMSEAKILDPQHRCLLKGVVCCGGQHRQETSVAVGIARLEDPWETIYSINNLIQQGNGMVSTSRAASAAAGRISYTFNYKGACLSIDTACSSSLVALKVVGDTFGDPDSKEGVVCGVSLPMSARTSMMLASSSMLARDGRCKTLDASADGYGRSEACLAMKLRPRALSHAMGSESSDGVVLSSAINQDGASASLAAPHGPSQEHVLLKGLLHGDISPTRVRIAGTHGTGTPLGDPIEVSAIQQRLVTENAPTTLSSSKAQYGHAETASGILGLLYVSLISKQSRTEDIANLRYLNPHLVAAFNRGKAALHAPREVGPCILQEGQTAICSISAFAFQGSNACAFVESNHDHPAAWGAGSENERACLCTRQSDLLSPKGHRLVSDTIIRTPRDPYFICGNVAPSLQLMDHVVLGRSTLPAAGTIHLMQTAVDTLRNENRVNALNNLNFEKVKLLSKGTAMDLVVQVRAERVSVSEKGGHARADLCSARISRLTRSDLSLRGEPGDAPTAWRSFWSAQGEPRPRASSYGLTECRHEEFMHVLDSNWHLSAANQSTPEDLHVPSTVSVFQHTTTSTANYNRLHTSLQLESPMQFPDQAKCLSSVARHRGGTHPHLQVQAMVLRRVHHGGRQAAKPAPLYGVHSQTMQPFDPTLHFRHSATVTTRCGSLEAQLCTILQAVQTRGEKPLSDVIHSPTTWIPPNCTRCHGQADERVDFAAFRNIKELPEEEARDTSSKAFIKLWGDPSPSISEQTFYFKSQVILAGGSGGIGRAVREWLCLQGVGTVSFSRRGHGTSVPYTHQTVQMCKKDVSESDTGCMGQSPGQLTMHAAGVLHDQLIRDVRIDAFRRVFSPKYHGSLREAERGGRFGGRGHLHFGSVAAVLGNVGQASYVLANSALEDVSVRLSDKGIPSTIIHWGPWKVKEGIATSRVLENLQRLGTPLLSPLDGLSVLQSFVICFARHSPPQHHTYCSFDYAGYYGCQGEGEVASEGDTVASLPEHREADTASTAATVIRIATDVVGDSMEDMDESSRFVDHGLSSLLTAEFAEALNNAFHLGVTSTVVFDYPTVKDLSDHIIAEMSRRRNRSIAAADSGAPIVPGTRELQKRVGIVAKAQRYPAEHIDTAWADAGDFQKLTPPSRWNIDEHYSPGSTPGRMYVRFGCWLDGIDHFEGRFFGLAPHESLTVDPQIRVLLELSQEIRSNVHLHPNTSNFVGVMYNEYLDSVLGPMGLADEVPSSITTNGMSFMVGRISYHHKLRGRAVALDTACSSSLVAAHMGYLSAAGAGDVHALAHGINLMLSPQTTARICLIKALSPVGRCKTADSTADGYGRSESGCTICMVPWSVQAPVDSIWIQGTSVSHNGASGGLTAPHGRSQANLILSVQSRSPTHEVPSVVSLHGTGTVLGDPIEFGALKTALAESLPKDTGGMREQQQSLVATKSCLGHTEGNAGLCGLMLPLVHVQRRLLSPIKHLRSLNSHIETLQGEKPHRFVRQAAPGFFHEHGRLATCGTNSFGMSGVNAHMMCVIPIPWEDTCDGGLSARVSMVWQRARRWPWPPIAAVSLAHSPTEAPRLIFSANPRQQALNWIHDHIVGRHIVLPGAVSLSMLTQALRAAVTTENAHALWNIAFIRPAPMTGSPYAIQIDGQSIVLQGASHDAAVVSATICRVSRQIRSSSHGHGGMFWAARVPGPGCATSLATAGGSMTSDACTLDAAMHLALAAWPAGRGGQVPVKMDLYHCLPGGSDDFTASLKDFVHNTVDISVKDQSIRGLQSSAVPRLAEERRGGEGLAPGLYARELRVDSGYAADTPVSRAQSCAIYRDAQSMQMAFGEWYAPLEVAKGGWSAALAFVLRGGDNADGKHADLRSMASSLTNVIAVEAPKWAVHCLQTSHLSAPSQLPGSKLRVGACATAVAQGRCMATIGYASCPAERTSKIRPSIGRPNCKGASIVTGAFGGIGTLVSDWLAGHGQRLIRAGRGMPSGSSLSDPKAQTLQACVKCDSRFAADLQHVLNGAASTVDQLSGIHHTAGVLKDKMLFRATPGDFLGAAAPKSAPLNWMLERANLGRVEYAVGYSSISSILGNKGQIAYTFANTQLNAVCCNKREHGMDATAVAWGPWRGTGMVKAAGLSGNSFSKSMMPISPEEGLVLLETIMEKAPHHHHGLVIAGAYGRGAFAGPSSPPDNEIPEARQQERVVTLSSEGASRRFSGMEDLASFVTDTLERLLGTPSTGMSDNIVGELDSLQSVTAAEQLSAALQMDVSPTVLYDYPRFQDLVHHLGSQYFAGAKSSSSTETVRPEEPRRDLALVPGVVSEEGCGPALPAGYYCSPAPDSLRRLPAAELASVRNFVIGREGVGEIRFLYPVDLTRVDLRRSVKIIKGGMVLAGSASRRPGEGLNQPAILVFKGTSKKMFRSQKSRRLLVSKVRAACDRMGATLVHIDEDAAEWMVKIDCFSSMASLHHG